MNRRLLLAFPLLLAIGACMPASAHAGDGFDSVYGLFDSMSNYGQGRMDAGNKQMYDLAVGNLEGKNDYWTNPSAWQGAFAVEAGWAAKAVGDAGKWVMGIFGSPSENYGKQAEDHQDNENADGSTTGGGDTPVVSPTDTDPVNIDKDDDGKVQDGSGGSGDGSKAQGSADGGKGTPDGQTLGDDRWSDNVKGPNTPFFGPTAAKAEENYSPTQAGAKGLAAIPGFSAGTICTGSHCGKSGEKGLSYGNPSGSGGTGMGSHGSSGGFGGSGGGGGSPSLGSLLGSMDKPAGFEAIEKKAAEELMGGEGDASAISEPSPSEAEAPRPDAMNFDKAVPVMGDGSAPGEQEARRVAQLLESAKSKLNARDYKGAIDDLSEALKIAPKNPTLWLHRSMAYNLAGNYEAAEKDALEAIKLDPENSRAWENLAWAQLKQGKFLEAMESATRALKLDPKNAFAYAIRAFAREKLGNGKGAMDDIKRATALDKRFLPFYQRGMRGQPIYDPNYDYSPFFLQKGKPLQKDSGPMWPVYLGMTLLLLCFTTLGGVGIYYQTMKQKGKFSNFQDFLNSLKK
ncbi:MAG TPA: hypothetical protein DCM05_10870 [Elusimicrobia bacterium]|nr:hypothetical protein [Elusimicrobiota bacterium]